MGEMLLAEQSNATVVVVAIFTAVQVCFGASVAAGWHPWESKRQVSSAESSTSKQVQPTELVKSPPAEPPSVGTVVIDLVPTIVKESDFSVESCTAQAMQIFKTLKYSDMKSIEGGMLMDQTTIISAKHGSTKASIDCGSIDRHRIIITVGSQLSVSEAQPFLDEIARMVRSENGLMIQ